MPVDLHDDDDELKAAAKASSEAVFKDYDCPGCNANNPCDPPIGEGSEVLCNYCGTEFVAKVTDGGKLKLKEV